jgi:hypothetical protein
MLLSADANRARRIFKRNLALALALAKAFHRGTAAAERPHGTPLPSSPPASSRVAIPGLAKPPWPRGLGPGMAGLGGIVAG